MENTGEELRTITLPNHPAKAQLQFPCQTQQEGADSSANCWVTDTSSRQKRLMEEMAKTWREKNLKKLDFEM